LQLSNTRRSTSTNSSQNSSSCHNKKPGEQEGMALGFSPRLAEAGAPGTAAPVAGAQLRPATS
jgi:hypothetical protein